MISGEEIIDIARAVTFRMNVPSWLREEAIDEATAAACEAAKSWNGCGSVRGWIGYKTRFALINFLRKEIGMQRRPIVPAWMDAEVIWRTNQELWHTVHAIRQLLTDEELLILCMVAGGYHWSVIMRLIPGSSTKTIKAALNNISAVAKNLETVGVK